MGCVLDSQPVGAPLKAPDNRHLENVEVPSCPWRFHQGACTGERVHCSRSEAGGANPGRHPYNSVWVASLDLLGTPAVLGRKGLLVVVTGLHCYVMKTCCTWGPAAGAVSSQPPWTPCVSLPPANCTCSTVSGPCLWPSLTVTAARLGVGQVWLPSSPPVRKHRFLLLPLTLTRAWEWKERTAAFTFTSLDNVIGMRYTYALRRFIFCVISFREMASLLYLTPFFIVGSSQISLYFRLFWNF